MSADPEIVYCSKCHEKFGEVSCVEGVDFLKTDKWLIRVVGAVCLKCGEPYHRSVSEKQVEKIYKFNHGFIRVE